MKELKLKALMVFVFLWTVAPPAIGEDVPADMRAFFDAIQTVETGGSPDPATAVGDGGKSLGWYQIGRLYWLDATRHDQSIGGRYEDVTDRAYAESCMMAYFERWEPEAIRTRDFETLARLHNAGPSWARIRPATDGYWRDVQRILRSNGGTE